MNKLNTAVIGGDKRMRRLYELLKENGECVIALNGGTDDIKAAARNRDAVILPVPCSLDGVFLNCPSDHAAPRLAEVAELIEGGTVLFGGGLTEEIKELCTRQGVTCRDLLEDEALLIKNAQLTAEGALEYTFRELDRAVLGANMLVIGFGRVGQATARILTAVGAKVWVSARSSAQLALAQATGCSVIPLAELKNAAGNRWDMIYNTVPAGILADILPSFKAGTPLMELASGNIYEEAAKKAELPYIIARALPGKTAPETAALIIYERIIQLLQR